MTLNKYRQLALVLWQLGIFNIFNFALYRLKLRCGYTRACTPVGISPSGGLFDDSKVRLELPQVLSEYIVKSASDLRDGMHPLFNGDLEKVGSPPQWFQLRERNDGYHWSYVSINNQVNRDVKLTWDLSRFQWAPILAAAYSITSDKAYLETLNLWASDWCEQNPPNIGVNWVCAQEVSIRMLHLLNAAKILAQDGEPSGSLVQFVRDHCARIAPTLQYSIAQANNHGISESVALFIGGSWLSQVSKSDSGRANGDRYASLGRRVLEKLIARLISSDGSFSMYSLNYHRVVLDTLSLSEFWRRELQLKPFSSGLLSKASTMVDYLFSFVDGVSGDVPNLGANDGSRPFLLTASGYRDFRPTVQLGACLFQARSRFSAPKCSDSLAWMKLPLYPDYEKKELPNSYLFEDSGFAVLVPKNVGMTWACMRFPRYKFRPGHSDQLHFDLWHNGRNILCDSGTYSYNANTDVEEYFTGSKGHNTVQFDYRESMPRISRFLVADWLNTRKYDPIQRWIKESTWSANYKDCHGVEHTRSVHCDRGVWLVTDVIKGYTENAILRWHLAPLNWRIDGHELKAESIKIAIKSDGIIKRFNLLSGYHSLFYSVIEQNPLLEVEVGPDASNIITEIFLG